MIVRNVRFIYLLCLMLLYCSNGFAQTASNYDHSDSAILYINKAITENGLDTALFYKGIDQIYGMTLTRQSVAKMDAFSRDLYNQNQIELAYHIIENLYAVLCRSDSADLAIQYLSEVLNNYNQSMRAEDRSKALVALQELRIPLRETDMASAFNFYTKQLEFYIGKNDSAALTICYFCIASCYRLIGLTDLSIYNFKKSLSFINKNSTNNLEPLSGIHGWNNNTSVLGQLSLEIGEYEAAIQYSTEAKIVRLKRIEFDKNVSFLNGNIALAKLSLNDLDSLPELIDESINLASSATDYASLVRCLEIKGRYLLTIGQLDSAEVYFIKTKEAMNTFSVPYFNAAGTATPGYYLAKIYVERKQYNKAKAILEEEISQITNIRAELLKEQKLLITVYLNLGDSDAANALFTEYINGQTELYEEERKNRTTSFEVEAKIELAENTIKNLETEQAIAEVTKKYLIGIAAMLLIVAIIIFNRFRITRKQKIIIEKEQERSEQLLLNILPAEVASELKAKGSAEARQFDTVTVMFTDFKGFTQISEKLSPTQLVAEIHTCFKAFDDIINKHNIEKIKTIGDAYMCAGGLSLTHPTNAIDVIHAALDILSFMEQHIERLKKENKPVFEIRIGIHTGPVVAGIVGVKKFSYDIWGDTVNIAARMESSGEVGKINISKNTYEEIKNVFPCVYRGKVEAKNKGTIDMYFVDASGKTIQS